MPRYRVIDPEQNVIDEKEFADDTKAYDWFKTCLLYTSDAADE